MTNIHLVNVEWNQNILFFSAESMDDRSSTYEFFFNPQDKNILKFSTTVYFMLQIINRIFLCSSSCMLLYILKDICSFWPIMWNVDYVL